jgi:hypothetical protein
MASQSELLRDLDGSLALIGNGSAYEGQGANLYPSRGVFDKET